MPDRRKFSQDDLEAMGRIVGREVRHELEDRASFKKNGHTWKEWLAKVATPERVGLTILAILGMAYTFGGDVRAARKQLQEAAEKADIASTKADLAASKSEAAASKAEASTLTQGELKEQIAVLQQQVAESRQANEAFRRDVRSKLSVSVTRGEFSEAVERRIIPRLDRIEKAQPK